MVHTHADMRGQMMRPEHECLCVCECVQSYTLMKTLIEWPAARKIAKEV